MSNISNLIEQFILDALGESGSIEIARNSLADYFNCAPSQINYVLETRFTLDRGFSKLSKRGGGGYIKISRIRPEDDQMLVLESVGDELSFKRLSQIISRLTAEKVIGKKEASLLKLALGEEALVLPIGNADKVRANAFKCVLIGLMNSKEEK